MRDEQDFQDSRRMLVALLAQDNDPPMIGLDEIDVTDRLKTVVTASADVIVHTLCLFTAYRSDKAQEGLTKLIEDMRRKIGRLCGDH